MQHTTSSHGGSTGGNRSLQMCTFTKRWNTAAKDKKLVRCECGVICRYYMSMTDDNPSRRFIRCGNHRVGGCCYWEWFDPLLCNTAKEFIPLIRDEMLRLMDALQVKESMVTTYENEIRRLRGEVRQLRNDVDVGDETSIEACNARSSICPPRSCKALVRIICAIGVVFIVAKLLY